MQRVDIDEVKRPRVHGWIYPGEPAHEAAKDLQALKIAVVRAQFFNLDVDGNLERLNEDNDNMSESINGFSQRTLLLLQKNAEEQLVTIGAQLDGLRALLTKASALKQELIDSLIEFCLHHKLSGIDLDFEGFDKWTQSDYNNYLRLVTMFGRSLHKRGLKLAVCGPADEHPARVSWCFDYQDLIPLPIDYITIMCYDYMYLDTPMGPLAPLQWIETWTRHLLLDLSIPVERLVVGLPAYSYRQIGSPDSQQISNLTFDQVRSLVPAFLLAKAERDPQSSELVVEMRASSHHEHFQVCDATSVSDKADAAVAAGATSIALWHLGGNPIHTCCYPANSSM